MLPRALPLRAQQTVQGGLPAHWFFLFFMLYGTVLFTIDVHTMIVASFRTQRTDRSINQSQAKDECHQCRFTVAIKIVEHDFILLCDCFCCLDRCDYNSLCRVPSISTSSRILTRRSLCSAAFENGVFSVLHENRSWCSCAPIDRFLHC